MMIDGHAHFGSLPHNGKMFGSFEEYKRICDEIGVSKYCMQPIGVSDNFSKKTTPDNGGVLSALAKDTKIIPIYWFNVFDLPETIDGCYKAIKLHSDIGQVEIDDKKVIDFVNKINLPVFVHTNENKEYSNLDKVIKLAENVEVPVVALHSGSVTKTFFKLDGYKFPDNIYFETSGIQYAFILKKIYQMVGADRIIFGSDYPFGDPRVSLAMIETLDATKKEYANIVGKNIEKILKL